MHKLTIVTITLLVMLQKSTEGQIVNTINGNPVNSTTITVETRSCPVGQVSNGYSCVQACQCGYTHDPISHRCYKKQAIVHCPPGYHHNPQSHRCTKQSSPTTYSGPCPAGHGWSGEKCLPLRIPVGCPDGFKFENGQCTRKHYGSMICPENHVVDPKNHNNCVSKVSLIPECPADFKLVNNRCEKLTKEPLKCLDGYIFDGKSCSKTEISQQSVCPPDFNFENGICVRKSVATGECPQSYERVGEKCIKRTEVVLRCGTGYILQNNECVKFEKSVLHCSLPHTLIDGRCVLSIKL